MMAPSAAAKTPITIRLCGPRGFARASTGRSRSWCSRSRSSARRSMSAMRSCITVTSWRGSKPRGRFSSRARRDPARAPRAARGLLRPWSAQIRPADGGRAQSLLSRRHLSARLEGAQAGMRHHRMGRHVVLIGHAGHPEVIGTMGQLPEGRSPSSRPSRMPRVYMPPDPDISASSRRRRSRSTTPPASVKRLHERFPNLTAPAADSICYATRTAGSVKQAAPGCDLFLSSAHPTHRTRSASSKLR